MKKKKNENEKRNEWVNEFAFIAFDHNHDVIGIYLKQEDLPKETRSFVCACIH